MKITSKSILSPARTRARDPPTSLSTSLSRRLKNSGSIKGGASPAMFPTVKKRGAFDNPEPSSPKVTLHGFCVKDQNVKESLNLGGSKGSENVLGQSQKQECSQVQRSWVHFPVTICEALRAFGSEFSCLIPCRTDRGKEVKSVSVEEGRNGSCGAVFARWLVAVQDGNGERDIELVVGDEDEDEYEEEEDGEVVGRKTRRHVFEDLEIVDGRVEGHKDEGRVSVCVPPKNALLLMRCRSEPMKSEGLGSRCWEPSIGRNEEEDEKVFDSGKQIKDSLKGCEDSVEVEQQEVMVVEQDQENVQQVEGRLYEEQNEVQQDEVGQDQEVHNVLQHEANQDQEFDTVQKDEVGQDQEFDILQKDEVGQDQEDDNVQQYEVGHDQECEQAEVDEESFYLVSLFEEIMNQDYEIQEQDEHEIYEEADDVAESVAEELTMVAELTEIAETREAEVVKEVTEHNNEILEVEKEVKEKRGSEEVLPDCLLMMLHEPKLSLNVSKETWVCSTDFIRRPSNRKKPPAPPIKPDGRDESSIGATATVNNMTRVGDREFPTVLQQPARSSCSLPMAPSMATLLEQKLVNAVGYEPFVLTRCKSEPMKTAASKLLLPESCVWENRNLEGLSRVTFGLGF